MRARDPDTGESDNGFIFRAQHMCRGGGRRWFRDVWIIGEILTNWLVCDGPPAPPLFKCTQGFEWSKQDTVIGACTNFIAGEIRARAAERRGQRPGEDAQGRPAGNQ